MNPVAPNEFFVGADYKRQSWHVVVPNDTLLTDILKPAFWVNVAPSCKPHALIDVMTPDGTLDMQLRVVKIVAGVMTVRPRFIWEDKEARAHLYAKQGGAPTAEDPAVSEAPVPDGYKVGWNPGKKLHYVQLKATGVKLKEDFATRPEAIGYAIAHSKMLNTPSKAA